jgi:hypothetical protein
MHRESTERRLGFETLETRQMLAGNVTAEVVGDDLVINGDKFSNQIHIIDNGDGVDVVGSNNTRINGVLNGYAAFNQITGDLKIRMGGGNDRVFVDDVGKSAFSDGDGKGNEVLGQIIIMGGYGRDGITVRSTFDDFPVINGLRIYGGPARDRVRLIGVDVADSDAVTDLFVSLGGGHDTFVVESDDDVFNSDIRGNLVIDAGAGNDALRLTHVTVFDNLRVLLRGGADRLAFEHSTFAFDVQVYGGYGPDVIGAISSQFLSKVLINGNGGRDTILASRSGLGFVEADTVRLLGGPEGDWFAVIRGSGINGTTHVGGGRGFDNAFDDGTNTVNGSFTSTGVEGNNRPPKLQAKINALLAIT